MREFESTNGRYLDARDQAGRDCKPVEPWCPFCGGVMTESEDHKTLECVACGVDAILEVPR